MRVCDLLLLGVPLKGLVTTCQVAFCEVGVMKAKEGRKLNYMLYLVRMNISFTFLCLFAD